MHRSLIFTMFAVMFLAVGCGGSKSNSDAAANGDGSGGDGNSGKDGAGDAALDGAGDAALDGMGDSAGDAGDPAVPRGAYLVGVLGCNNCHTPKVAGGMMPDMTKLLSGVDCFVKDANTGGCLASANLTPDDTGLKKYTDAQIIDAFRTGKDPDGTGHYLFAQMPYYQFANLSDADAAAIVAYLRSIPAVMHMSPDNTAPFDMMPTSPEWAAVAPGDVPAAGGGAPADAANGKYLATILCVTCHTVDAMGATPKHVDASKAFAGGKEATTTVMGMMKKIQSVNLTPDATGLMGWTAAQIATTIKTGKDDKGNTVCTPMRPYSTMTDGDAMAIADYLQSIPAVSNAITETCE